MELHYTIAQAAKHLGCTRDQLWGLVRQAKLPEPTHFWGNAKRRSYTYEEVEGMRPIMTHWLRVKQGTTQGEV